MNAHLTLNDAATPIEAPIDCELQDDAGRIVGTVIVNGGGEALLIPEEDLKEDRRQNCTGEMAGAPICEQCNEQFAGRVRGVRAQHHSGAKPPARTSAGQGRG